MDKLNFDYCIPTRIIFGSGTLKSINKEDLPGKNALIVLSSGGSARKNGYLDILTSQFEMLNITFSLFEKIQPNPTLKSVMDGAKVAKDNKCDFIIGFGGGSSIDAAKAIAIMAVNDGDYWDYIPSGSGNGKPIKNNPLPIMAISTTSGTGTESDPWTVITNETKHEKIGFGYSKTFPTVSIVDPETTFSIPSHLTAYQGFDALFHSIEGYLSVTATPISDMYAIKAISLIGKYLPRAVIDGKDLTARENMALANILAGFIQSTSSCISEHSLEHALSAYHTNLPHGAGLIIISNAYFSALLKAPKLNQRFIDMARALGNNDATKSEDFIDALLKLQHICGVDNLKMSDYGIQINEAHTLAENAMSTMRGLFECDPVTLSLEDCVKILEESYK